MQQQQERLSINCLVQVLGNSELDFTEWVDYHIALGFDTIYVFDSGSHDWLPGICTRRKAHVVLVPSEDAPDGAWTYKSDIISAYVARRSSPEWCICLEDNEFLWIGPKAFRGVRDYVGSMPIQATACTLYTKVLSSKEPTRYRVGTQIDCFTHARREPEGFTPSYGFLPNGGVTFFLVRSRTMPLRGPAVPVDVAHWVDASFRPMSERRYVDETSSRKFSPMSYPARCYKFGIRSGIEMGFKDDAVPQGFDVLDLNLQHARERLLHVPVNPDTETLFAKSEPAEQPGKVMVESSTGEQVPVDEERAAEMRLPISAARVDKMILKGEFFEDICAYAATKDPDFDRAALERVFNRERENIIKCSLPYADLQELIDQGKGDAEIMRTLVITASTLDRMKRALPVLDIRPPEPAEPVPDGVDSSVAVEVAQFDASVAGGAMTPEQQKDVGDALEARENRSKAARTRKGAKQPKAKPAATASSVGSAPAPAADTGAEPETLDLGGAESLLDSVDLSGIMANIEAHDA